MASALDFVKADVDNLKAQGLYMQMPVLEGPQTPRTTINGRELINLSSNNYLGLATHPRLIDAAKRALDTYGVGIAAGRIICGTTTLQLELERKVAEFKHAEAVIVFQTGYATNAGVIPALFDSNDAIVSDELNHASLVDGSRMSRAKILIYKHCNLASAEQQLQAAKESGARRILLVTDGVFSMDGDIAPLAELVRLAKKYDAITMVDDAHAVGVLGECGRGTASYCGVEDAVDIQMGTLSKALGVIGGYIAGPQPLIDWLGRRHRPFVFSASTLPPSDVAACIAALAVLQEEPDRIQRLWSNSAHFREGLKGLGFNTGKSETPIIPVIVGDPERASTFSARLIEKGVFTTPIIYPVVARDQSRLRTIMTSEHTLEQLDEALAAFGQAGRELKIIA